MALSHKTPTYDGRQEIQDHAVRRAIDDLASRIQAGFNQVVAHISGVTPAPPPISSLTITAADGVFEATIQDNNPVMRGIEYFLEYSSAPQGPWTVVSLGPSRGPWRQFIGNRTLYWRAYSQYPTSAPSNPVYFGPENAPTGVLGGGALNGPAPGASAGSGTAPSSGLVGGAGYGKVSTRNSSAKIQLP